MSHSEGHNSAHSRREVTWKEQRKKVKVNPKRMESTGLELGKEEGISQHPGCRGAVQEQFPLNHSFIYLKDIIEHLHIPGTVP